jgi:hypothetical protein
MGEAPLLNVELVSASHVQQHVVTHVRALPLPCMPAKQRTFSASAWPATLLKHQGRQPPPAGDTPLSTVTQTAGGLPQYIVNPVLCSIFSVAFW